MELSTYIILVFLHVTLGEDCIINNVPEQVAFEKQLRKDLRCNYQVFNPPKVNGSELEVNVRFVMKRFDLSIDKGVFSVRDWMFASWIDERLKWDPEKYYGIEETEMHSVYIWTPTIRLFNSADSYDFDIYFRSRCQVKSTGEVSCVYKLTHEAICITKLTHWPYDQQVCSMEFGVYFHSYKLNFTSRAMHMFVAEYGAEWFISDYKQERNNSADRQLKMFFTLERESMGLGAIVVYPAFVLSALSITCLFLDVRRLVRLSLACFSLLGHYYFLTELASNMPKSGIDSPNLLLYYRSSVILTVLIISVTFLLHIVCKLRTIPPNYIISVNCFIYESFGKYFVFPLWDVNDVSIDSKLFSEDWTKFSNVINSAFAFMITIVYISLYCTLVPKPIPINFD